jgi:PPOX class probable F420-dependent enzyme
MTELLPDLAVRLLDSHKFFVLTTINPDGGPQSSVIWAKRDGDVVVFSTILGRRKTLNMQRDPRVSLVAFDPDDPYLYVEVRGTVTMDPAGGDDLIDELCRAYTGEPWARRPTEQRVVCRVTVTKAVNHT